MLHASGYLSVLPRRLGIHWGAGSMYCIFHCPQCLAQAGVSLRVSKAYSLQALYVPTNMEPKMLLLWLKGWGESGPEMHPYAWTTLFVLCWGHFLEVWKLGVFQWLCFWLTPRFCTSVFPYVDYEKCDLPTHRRVTVSSKINERPWHTYPTQPTKSYPSFGINSNAVCFQKALFAW